METRADLRRDFPYEVRIRCGRCQRVIGSLYSNTLSAPSLFRSTGRGASGALAPGSRVDWFREHRKCSADWPVRWDKLVPAYAVAAARPNPRDRVITLPFDL